MFKNKKILGMPVLVSLIVLVVIIILILVGSFKDYEINVALANKTNVGNIFASYGMSIAYVMYPIAGMCLFKGLKKKNLFFAWVTLVIAYFLAVYYSNSYMGDKVRTLFGYNKENPNYGLAFASYLFWIVIYSWIPPLFNYLLDDSSPELLITIGASILVAGIVSDAVNQWLKQVASRPRYKYLLTLEDPKSEYRNWWEWKPYFAGSNDSFKSWPSGNVAIASMVFALPLVLSNIKKTNKIVVYSSFALASIYVCIMCYNRIHMTNHYLSDVAFGALCTYLIFAVITYAFTNKYQKQTIERTQLDKE